MANKIALTDAQFNLLRDIVVYARANLDDINEAFGANYNEAEIEQLQNEFKERVATLSLKVTYDPNVTDADELCGALNTLLETALDTQGVMDEYGDPEIGAFHPVEDT